MYRIELSPGEETAFRSIEELAVAIRRGVVTPRARIWHNASSKWLPITFHPHYKAAASMQLSQADLVAGPPVKKLELLTLGELMEPPAPPAPLAHPAQPARPAPPARPALPARPAPRAQEPVREKPQLVKEPVVKQPAPKKKRASKPRGRSGRDGLRLALAGAILIAGLQLAYTAASAAFARSMALVEDAPMRPRTHRRLVTIPTTMAEQGRPETTSAMVMSGLPRVTRPPTRPSGTTRPRPAPTLPAESALESETSTAGASAPELGPGPHPVTPAPTGGSQSSAPEIQPAPSTIDIATPAVRTDSLAPKMVDSTDKKTLKRILRAIGGPAAPDRAAPKR